MKRLAYSGLSAICFAALATMGSVAVTPRTANAQLICYDSYVLLSGRCPDSCGRGADCPCYTCNNQT